jgi:hypothetical protein
MWLAKSGNSQRIVSIVASSAKINGSYCCERERREEHEKVFFSQARGQEFLWIFQLFFGWPQDFFVNIVAILHSFIMLQGSRAQRRRTAEQPRDQEDEMVSFLLEKDPARTI